MYGERTSAVIELYFKNVVILLIEDPPTHTYRLGKRHPHIPTTHDQQIVTK